MRVKHHGRGWNRKEKLSQEKVRWVSERAKYCRVNFKARPQPLKLAYLTGGMPTCGVAVLDFKKAELIRVEMKSSQLTPKCKDLGYLFM